MKKIVICDTALASSNVGDEIILDSICGNMSDIFDENFSLRLATHVNNFSAKQVAHSYVKQFLHKGTKIKYFQQADWKFICGTNLIAQKRLFKINTQWKLYPSNLSVYKNCILIGVGTYGSAEKFDLYGRMIYNKVLSRQYAHSVRDELTKKLMKARGSVYAMTQEDTDIDLVFRASGATCLVPSSAVRGSGESRYVLTTSKNQSAFGGSTLKLSKQDVTVLGEYGGVTSVENDLSNVTVAYGEDRPIADGDIVMEYVN